MEEIQTLLPRLASVIALQRHQGFVLTFSRGAQQETKDDGVLVQTLLPAGTITELYQSAGLSIADFDPSVFMTAEQFVGASLAGLDGE